MNIIIEKAQAKDYDRLREIFYSTRLENFHWLKKEEIKITDFDECTVDELILVAKTNENILGFISIYEKEKFIHNLFIDSKFKRCGAGKALLTHAIENIGFPLSLKCVKKNEKALKFYMSLGWKIIEEVSDEEPYYLIVYNRIEFN